jgi:hypothetical protein
VNCQSDIIIRLIEEINGWDCRDGVAWLTKEWRERYSAQTETPSLYELAVELGIQRGVLK